MFCELLVFVSMFLLTCSVLIIRLFNAKRTYNEALAISLLFYYLIIIFLPLIIYTPLGKAFISLILALLKRFIPSIV